MAKGIGGHQSAKNRTDVWITPSEIIQALGPFDLDPCASVIRPWPVAKTHYTIIDDGLSKKWKGRIFMNPPYGTPKIITPWMKGIVDHGNGIALIFARTETKMFFRYVWDCADSIFFIQDRLFFYDEYGQRAKANAGAPSVLIGYGENNSQSISDSGLKGRHIPLTYTSVLVVTISGTWIDVVTIAVKSYGDTDLKPIYEMVERIAPDKIANNGHWKEKVRQQVQVIRKNKINGTFGCKV